MAVDCKSATKVLKVQEFLYRNFAHGFSSTEIAEGTGYSASDITRFVATLEKEGWAERIPETNRIRPSIRHAQFCVQVQLSLDGMANRATEITARLFKGA